eukprot:GILJ01006412.1.p1 GENE.GILJ01006412.1~~GILJ01006412.1.p1  ORF type:complete len:1622 (+),score=306.28 GILJ01006412.1:470-4867(+)
MERAVAESMCRTAFTTMPALTGACFLLSSTVEQDDVDVTLNPIIDLFHELESVVDGGALRPSNLLAESRVFFCHRVSLIPQLLVRDARVEDHDDLVAVFNSQSEVMTEIYGDYFVAELIEAQNETNKALVAEVDNRAVGLLALTSDVDVTVLHQCFDLEPYDNLLTPEYMHQYRVVQRRERERKRQQTAEEEAARALEMAKRSEKKTLKTVYHTPRTRVELQRFLSQRATDVRACLESLDENEEGDTSWVDFCYMTDQLQDNCGFESSLRAAILDAARFFGWQEDADIIKMVSEEQEAGAVKAEHLRKDRISLRQIRAAVTAFLYFTEDKRTAIRKDFFSQKKELDTIFEELKNEEGKVPIADLTFAFRDVEVISLQEETLDAWLPLLSCFTGFDSDALSMEEFLRTVDQLDPQNLVVTEIAAPIQVESTVVDTLAPLKLSNVPLGPEPVKRQGSQLSVKRVGERALQIRPTDEDDRSSVAESHGRESVSAIEYDEVNPNWETLDDLPLPPDFAKNAFCVTLFCLDELFESRAKDFLEPAFALYPDKDYCIVTQPHTSPESTLLNNFSLVPKKPSNTFSHVLYLFHRDALLAPLQVRRALVDDLEAVSVLLEDLDNGSEIRETVSRSLQDFADDVETFVSICEEQIVGFTVISNVVDLDFYRATYTVEDFILFSEHEGGHCRLLHFVLNPIFLKSSRNVLKDVMRLSRKSVLYFEVRPDTVLPDVFYELIQVRPRKLPRLLKRQEAGKSNHDHVYRAERKKLNNSSARVKTMMRMEGIPFDEDPEAVEQMELERKQKQAEAFALSFVSKKLLSEPKITVNTRIVVVGASDCGISFLETLLTMPYLLFTNLTLIAPGGLPYLKSDADYVKTFSTSYASDELRRLMLESRVRILDTRMIDIDRNQRSVILPKGVILPYDYLVLAAGLQDQTLEQLGLRSQGIEQVREKRKQIQGVVSVNDPKITEVIEPSGDVLTRLGRSLSANVVVYGGSLDAYCAIEGLLKRGINPQKIVLVLPAPPTEEELDDEDLVQDAFDGDEAVRQKVHNNLTSRGVSILENYRLLEIDADHFGNVRGVKLSVTAQSSASGLAGTTQYQSGVTNAQTSYAIAQAAVAAATTQKRGSAATFLQPPAMFKATAQQPSAQTASTPPHFKYLHCRLLITAGIPNVDFDVFYAVHENGLVYDGRLVVDSKFKTTDASIFAGGSLCQFSRRYKKSLQGRAARLDRYNGREVGVKMARAALEFVDPLSARPNEEEVHVPPSFNLPVSHGGIVPCGLYYYHMKAVKPIPAYREPPRNREDLISDTLQEDGSGHFCRFTFDSNGLIDSVTYLSGEDVEVSSLWSLVGLSERYINAAYERHQNGAIKDVIEFLAEDWALALYHDRFADFSFNLKADIHQQADMKQLLEHVSELTSLGETLTREQVDEIRQKVSLSTKKMMQERLVNYVQSNKNHLPMYFLREYATSNFGSQ